MNIEINIDELRDLIGVAIRRASAFVRFGLDGLDDRDGGDFNLTARIDYQFWPSEISPEKREAVREEYQAWLIGCCLREVDLFFGLFLDRIWFALEASELHGSNVSHDHVFDLKFARNTNSAAKYRAVAAKLGVRDYFDELNSLSMARNALAHHAGVVRSPYDCNNEGRDALIIKWLAFDMLAVRGKQEILVEHMPFDTHALPGDGPIQMILRFAERELYFKSGDPIRLTNPPLAEICMFYNIICNKSIDGYLDILRRKGIIEEGGEKQSSDTNEFILNNPYPSVFAT